MAHIFCVIDGMTDPGFTQSAYENLNTMVKTGETDTCHGCKPESLTCILHLLGVEQVPPHLRGYAEALGAGIPVESGDLILRGSWFGVQNGCCTLPVPGPETMESGKSCRYYHLEQYKSLLILPQMAEFAEKVETHPPYTCQGLPTGQMRPAGCPVLEAVFDRYCTPQKVLIPWGQSAAAKLPPFPGKGAVISGTTVVRGIGKMLQMDVISVPGATGDVDTDLQAKVSAALEAAKTHRFVLLHINGTDEASHRCRPDEKKAFLQRIDREVLGVLLHSGHHITVTADHGCDPATGKHMDFFQPVFENCL